MAVTDHFVEPDCLLARPGSIQQETTDDYVPEAADLAASEIVIGRAENHRDARAYYQPGHNLASDCGDSRRPVNAAGNRPHYCAKDPPSIQRIARDHVEYSQEQVYSGKPGES